MRVLILLSVLIITSNIFGQNAPITSAPEITCDPGTFIDIPITVTDFNNIGAFSLTLHYEDSVLNYQSYTNNSGFPSLMVSGAIAGQITSGGLNFTGPGISLPDNSVLFTLTFLCEDGSTELVWFDEGGSCEYTDYLYNPLDDTPTCLYYQNGSVNDNSFQLVLKVFLEGAYENGEMSTTLKDKGLIPVTQPYSGSPWFYDGTESMSSIPENAVDWVLVEMRETQGDASTATSDKMIARQAGLLMKDGSIKHIDDCGIGNLRFSDSYSDNLYVVIYHRNHIAVISASPLIFFNGNSNYNFTIGESKALGGSSGHKEIAPGVWGLVAGDSNADGVINALDKQNSLDPSSGSSGYSTADLSFDSQIDNRDKNEFWYLNYLFLSQVPN